MTSNTNNVAQFKNAGLPSTNLATFKQALQTATASLSLASGNAFLKMDKRDGTWRYGAEDIDVQDGSLWAVNPHSLTKGYVAWGKGEILGKQMRSVFQGEVDASTLPPTAALRGWESSIGFDLVCTNGDDTGVTVNYEQTSYGAKKAFASLCEAIIQQCSVDAQKIVPLVKLTSNSYAHSEYGEIYNPIFEVVKWASMNDEVSNATEKVAPAKITEPVQEPAKPVVTRQRRRPAAG